jgi:glucosamine--fructose-6-phosphate aminotransferase (isomerizing)
MTGQRMASEMRQQPEVLEALEGRRGEIADQVRAARPERLAATVLVARGSSDHAAIFGRYLLEPATRRPVALAAPSLITVYDADLDYRDVLVIAISQSGRTPEIATVLGRLRAAGGSTIAVTNPGDGPVADTAAVSIALGAGIEQAVPATKTVTAQALAFAIIAEALGPVPFGERDWARLPGAVAEVLDDPSPAEAVAEAIGDAPGLLTTGRTFGMPVALEAALKLKETSELMAEGYSSADLRHGPTVVVSAGFPILAFATAGAAGDDVRALAEDLGARGAAVHVVGDRPGDDVPIPGGLSEPFAAIVGIVRAQQIALSLARHRGLEPDAPRGLSKVTPTT